MAGTKGGCVGKGVGNGAGMSVAGINAGVGRDVWVSTTPVRAIGKAVFCTFVISAACGVVLQAVRRAIKIIRMNRDFIVIGNLLY
jgi:hypothetical protein